MGKSDCDEGRKEDVAVGPTISDGEGKGPNAPKQGREVGRGEGWNAPGLSTSPPALRLS